MLQVNFSPFPQLNTERLLLRQITLADADALFFLRSNEQVMAFIDREHFASVDVAVKTINTITENVNSNNGIMWGICLKENPALLAGTIGFWQMKKENYRGEIGYMLHPDLWGKGYAKEAIKEVIEFGFRKIGLHSIEAFVNPGNKASIGLLLSVGFVQEGYFKEDYFFRGKFLDTVVFSLVDR